MADTKTPVNKSDEEIDLEIKLQTLEREQEHETLLRRKLIDDKTKLQQRIDESHERSNDIHSKYRVAVQDLTMLLRKRKEVIK